MSIHYRGRPFPVRSVLEAKVIEDLLARGVPFQYEAVTVPYRGGAAHYTPDLHLGPPASTGVFVEIKGRLTPQDQDKHLKVREEHPDMDVRFVFGALGDGPRWAERHGFEWNIGTVPLEWT